MKELTLDMLSDKDRQKYEKHIKKAEDAAQDELMVYATAKPGPLGLARAAVYATKAAIHRDDAHFS